MKKSGFALLLGRSNVGKSTLVNALVKSKIAITSPKPQTTRFPIHGVVTREKGQIVFVDVPGVMHGAHDELSHKLMGTIKHTLQDVDVIVYVVDPTRAIGEEEKEVLRMIKGVEKPRVLVINKMDEKEKPFLGFYQDLAPDFAAVIKVSARDSSHIETLIDEVLNLLPEGEYVYPEGQITNISHPQWVSELIREKLFLRLRQEVPYSVHV